MAEAGTAQVAVTRSPMSQLAGPLLIIMILAMMVLPLPPFALDLLFTFNIAVSLLVLLMAVYVTKPLEFSLFPTVLLLTTLLRLSLNVASTRVVLLYGHTGPDAAGQVIESFGHFLIGGNYAVGIVVFVDAGDHQFRRDHERLRAAWPRWPRVSPWTPCRASRWRSTQISTRA